MARPIVKDISRRESACIELERTRGEYGLLLLYPVLALLMKSESKLGG